MSDILCIYYSRTGNTKKAMEEIAAALDAELLACFSRPGLAWEFSTSGTSFVILFYKFVIKV